MQLSMIVEAGSFQAAADQIGLTQPALSRNMRALELRLGARIFDRIGKRSVPTSLGRRLARSGLAMRAVGAEADALATQMASGATGELRIGVPPLVAGRFMTRLLARLIRENPNCSFDLSIGLVPDLRTMLENGNVDLLIGPKSLASAESDLTYQHLADDQVGILCRADHPLTAQATITVADLEKQRWLAHSRGSLLRQQTEDALVAAGLETIQITCETGSIRTVLEIVADTDLITTVPMAMTRPYLEDRLTFLPFEHALLQRPIGVIRRRNTTVSPLMRKLLSLLKAEQLFQTASG